MEYEQSSHWPELRPDELHLRDLCSRAGATQRELATRLDAGEDHFLPKKGQVSRLHGAERDRAGYQFDVALNDRLSRPSRQPCRS